MLLVPSIRDSVCFFSSFLPATSFFPDLALADFDVLAMFLLLVLTLPFALWFYLQSGPAVRAGLLG